MSRRHMHDFYRYGRRHGHGHDDIFWLLGLFTAIAGFVINTMINVISALFHAFGDGANRQGQQGCCGDFNNPNAAGPNYSGPQYNAQEQREAPRNYQNMNTSKAEPEVKKEEKTEKEDQQTENAKHTHSRAADVNIMLFVFTLIPAIITLASGKLMYTMIIVAAGFSLILLYNVIRAISGAFKNKAEVKVEEEDEEDAVEDNHEKLVREAFEKVFAIRAELYRVSTPEVKEKVEKLCSMAEKIIGEVRTNPESLKQASKFFYYHLDAFGEIFKKYLKLSSFADSSSAIEKVVDETEMTFDDMGRIFNEILESMMEKDMMNLKAEINVMKNSN